MSHETERRISTPTPDASEIRNLVHPDRKPSILERFDTRGKKVGAGAVIFALTAGLGYGGAKLAEGTNQKNIPEPGQATAAAPAVAGQPSPEATQPAAAIAAPKEAITPKGTPESSAVNLDIQTLQNMSLESFYALDRKQQLVLVADQLKGMDGYIGKNGEAVGKYNPLDIADISNTGEQIVYQFEYERANAFEQRDMTDLRSLDKVSAKKMLAGAYYYAAVAPGVDVTGEYEYDMKLIDSSTARMTVADTIEVDSESALTKGVDRKGNPIQYKDIAYTIKESNTKLHGRFVYVEYSDKNGTSRGLWLAEQNTSVNIPFLDNF